MPDQSPSMLRLEIRLASPRPAGKVILTNTGRAAIRVWRMGNEWGDPALSFEVAQGGRTWQVTRRDQVYTRNVPSSVAVLAGGTHAWHFDLMDGDWEAGAPLDQLLVPGALLAAVYEIPQSAEATLHGVWTGQVRSQAVRLED